MSNPNSLSAASSTPSAIGFPLHKLTPSLTKLWLASPQFKKSESAKLVNHYKQGVGILSGSMHLIAYVQRNGAVEEIPPPHHRFEIHQIANQPPPEECVCARYYHEEAGGAWRNLGREGEHHPVCEFRADARANFDAAALKGGKV